MAREDEATIRAGAEDVGVYVHVPFCQRICPYCDFAVVAGLPGGREDRTVSVLVREIEGRAQPFRPASLATIYLGGGTPSLLRPESLGRILGAIGKAFPGTPSEVTLEVNPSTTERERLPAFREVGVTRLSIGVQSFADATLKRLGRAHTAVECHATLEAARRAGFDNLSLDLIFGAQGQDLPAVLADVEAALAHSPEHVSAYALTVEPGTPLAFGVETGRLVLPSDDLAADMMLAVADRLEAAGLQRYEVSNYARPGNEAQHNARYWQRRAVLGVGIGAHSYRPPTAANPHGARPANERDLARWSARIESGVMTSPEPGWLSAAEARAEAAFLALRRRQGISAAAFSAEWRATPRDIWPREIENLVAAGLLDESSAGDLALTQRGWLLADSVFEHFVSPDAD